MFELELNGDHRAIIKVVGVGGGGSNAFNRMMTPAFRALSSSPLNTDAQALRMSSSVRFRSARSHEEGLGAEPTPEAQEGGEESGEQPSALPNIWCSSRAGWEAAREPARRR